MKINQQKEKSPYIINLKKETESVKVVEKKKEFAPKTKKSSFKGLVIFILICFFLIFSFCNLNYFKKASSFFSDTYNSIKRVVKLKEFLPFIKFYKKILANPAQQRYLILFQNNNELRPTGGFLGSFAILELEDNKVKKLEIPGEGPYGFRNLFAQRQEKWFKPPEPFLMINSHWEMQDMNWFPDFSSSAQKVSWFYEGATGNKVDGVIAFDTVFIEELFKLTGAVELPEYGKVISAENFLWDTQEIVESKEARASGEPKKFIADLAPLLLNKISSFSKNDYINLLFLIDTMRKEKHFLAQFNDEELEKEILRLGFAGEIKNSQKDFLMVINTNINGGKTDAMIKQDISHTANVLPDGSIIDEVEITRDHQGDEKNQFTRMTNNDYFRIYVPSGSKLVSIEGYDTPNKEKFLVSEPICEDDKDLKIIEGEKVIDDNTSTVINQEFGKTVFGNWMILKRGEKKTIKIKYLLPFKFDKSYSILIQKQAGTKNVQIKSRLILPEESSLTWSYPQGLIENNNEIDFKDNLDEDRYWAAAFE